jgi:hypothetical protein
MTTEHGDDVPSLDDVHRLIGAIVAATTMLEQQLASAAASLSRSPVTIHIVQGERGNTLIQMCRRLLKNGVGSVGDDEPSGRTLRLGLISEADTTEFLAALTRAEALLKERDAVTHSLWLANVEGSGIQAFRTTRSSRSVRTWTLDELERLRVEIRNAWHDIYTSEWNTSGSGMPRLNPRQGDVMG